MTTCLINSLERGSASERESGPLLNQEEAEAERDFLELCTSVKDVIGVDQTGAPLVYPLWDIDQPWCHECRESGQVLGSDPLHDSPEPSDAELQDESGQHITAFMKSMKSAFQSRRKIRLRNQLRHLGFLRQQPEYSRGIECFIECSSAFDAAELFQLVSGRLFSLPGIHDQVDQIVSGDDRLARFLQVLSQFAARWCIDGFVTWELPVVQAPLEGLPAELVAKVRGPGAIVSHVPAYTNSPSTQQRYYGDRESYQLGFPLNPKRKPLSEGSLTSGEETLFRMFILETAISQRIPPNTRGLVVRMLDAFQQHFVCGERFLQKLRSTYIHRP